VPDWFDRLVANAANGRFSKASVGRAFTGRDEIAAVLTAAARRRQEVELRRAIRRQDFADFVEIHSPGWRWKRGQSLEKPLEEHVFLETISEGPTSLNAMNAARTEFSNATTAATTDVEEVAVLQSMINALASTLYATKG
jgi:hypothetical protein